MEISHSRVRLQYPKRIVLHWTPTDCQNQQNLPICQFPDCCESTHRLPKFNSSCLSLNKPCKAKTYLYSLYKHLQTFAAYHTLRFSKYTYTDLAVGKRAFLVGPERISFRTVSLNNKYHYISQLTDASVRIIGRTTIFV